MRYRYDIVPLTRSAARDRKANRLESLRFEIRNRKQELRELAEELEAVRKSPLETERKVQVILNPGDLGYDEAPEAFCPTEYVGEFQWKQF